MKLLSILATIVFAVAPSSVLANPRHNRHHEEPCEENVSSNPSEQRGGDNCLHKPRTEAPSAAPTSAPSAAPTARVINRNPGGDCITSAGVFGLSEGPSAAVAYAYELETLSDSSSSVIPSLETSVVNSILSELFADDCAVPELRRRRLAATGVSTSPPDLPLEGVPCNSKINESNTCVVVYGQLTLYTDDEDSEKEEDFIQKLIKEKMDNGDFNSISDDVVRVSYTDLVAEPPVENPNTQGGTPESNGDRNATLQVGLLLGAGLLIVALIFIACGRRKLANAGGVDDETNLLSDQVPPVAGNEVV